MLFVFCLLWQFSGSGRVPWNVHGVLSIGRRLGSNIRLNADFDEEMVIGLMVNGRAGSVSVSCWNMYDVVWIIVRSVMVSVCPNEFNDWNGSDDSGNLQFDGGIQFGRSPLLQSILFDRSHRLCSTSKVIPLPHLSMRINISHGQNEWMSITMLQHRHFLHSCRIYLKWNRISIRWSLINSLFTISWMWPTSISWTDKSLIP